MNEVSQRAEALCRAVAGPDLANAPIYIVSQSRLPADLGGRSICDGYTVPSLDLHLREHIDDYRGRGPCMVINDLALRARWEADFEYAFLAVVLHELAHVLERPELFAERPEVGEAFLQYEALVVADAAGRDAPDDRPPYEGHELRFLRAALHLRHRAEQAGSPIAPGAVVHGYYYGLSHAHRYQRALGDEPERCADMLFRDLLAVPPPPAFDRLWAADLAAYDERVSRLKGVLS